MKYNHEWDKKNMKGFSLKYKTDFVLEFREACKKLGLVQSKVFKEVMQEVIERANKKED